MRTLRGLAVPVRDGTCLTTDVYLPDDETPAPALLHRTPYGGRRSIIASAAIDLERATDAGFAVVVQDVRGRGRSEGDFVPFVAEGADGYDAVEWVAAQEWCDGAVGMVGRSYPAAVQWFAAVTAPPHLRAVAPVTTGSETYEGSVYQGGAFLLGFNLFWARLIADPTSTGPLDEWYAHLPLTEVPWVRDRSEAAFYEEWLAHPQRDAYWTDRAVSAHYDRLAVPALHVGGWYDVFLGGTLQNYQRLRAEAATAEARAAQRLVIGPWAHGSALGAYPDHRVEGVPDSADLDLDDLQLRFFDTHLRGGRTPSWDGDEARPVRLFVQGANVWRDEAEWPLARAVPSPWYLQPGGGLAPVPPPDRGDPSRYVFDPRDPAPTLGGPTSLPGRLMSTDQGPRDQRPTEAREDVLVFTSDLLVEPLEVTGPLTAVIHAATSAADCDVVVKLCDVHPDGRSMLLAEGVRRGRARYGTDRTVPMTPGRAGAFTVDLVATSNVFLPGHCIRVAVTSSSFPRFDRNPGTGGPVAEAGPDDLRVAEQVVFHDAAHPSHVLLPVVAGGLSGGAAGWQTARP